MGISGAEIARKRADMRAVFKGFGVAPENWQSFQVFDALGDQWRIVAGMGWAYYQGLDYNVLPIVEGRLGVKKRDLARIFNDLRIMAAEAKTILNENP